MADLTFDAVAAAALISLFEDPRRHRLADRLEQALDRLEADPGAPLLGREEFRSELGLIHGTRVVADGEEWMILWRVRPDTTWVHYIGPTGSL